MRAVLLRLTIWCVLCAFSKVTIRGGGQTIKISKNEERKKKRALLNLVLFPRASLVVNMPHGILLSSPLYIYYLCTNSFRTDSHDTCIVDILTSIFLSKWTSSVSVQLGMRPSKIPLPPPWVLTSSSPLMVLCCAMLRLKVPMQL